MTSFGNWILDNIWLQGIAPGVRNAAILLAAAYALDWLIFGRGSRIVRVAALLALPLVMVPIWNPDYSGGFDPSSKFGTQGQKLPFLKRGLSAIDSAWAWSRQVAGPHYSGAFAALPEVDGLTDARLPVFAMNARTSYHGSDQWIAFARSGAPLSPDRPLSSWTVPVVSDHGPFAGLGFQEVYQVRDGQRRSVFLLSRAPSWQFRIGSMVSSTFAQWLASISGFQTIEMFYWMFVITGAVIVPWSIRRAAHATRVALRIRKPEDTHPLIADIFVFFVLGDRGGWVFLNELFFKFGQRSKVDVQVARREYSKSALTSVLELKVRLRSALEKRSVEIFSRR